MKKIITLFAAMLLLLLCTAAQADPSAEAALCVFRVSDETYVRTVTAPLNDHGPTEGEAYAFAFFVSTDSPTAQHFKTAYARIDGGKKLSWADGTLEPGAKYTFHIYQSNMKKLSPGQHHVQLYFDDV